MYKTVRNLTVFGIGISASALVGWLLLRETKRSKKTPDTVIKSQRISDSEEVPEIVLPREALDSEDTPAQTTTQDDLTEIKGIGARFAEALQAAGINSFEQLAEQTPERLAELLSNHVTIQPDRIRKNDWIGQAAQRVKSR